MFISMHIFISIRDIIINTQNKIKLNLKEISSFTTYLAIVCAMNESNT